MKKTALWTAVLFFCLVLAAARGADLRLFYSVDYEADYILGQKNLPGQSVPVLEKVYDSVLALYTMKLNDLTPSGLGIEFKFYDCYNPGRKLNSFALKEVMIFSRVISRSFTLSAGRLANDYPCHERYLNGVGFRFDPSVSGGPRLRAEIKAGVDRRLKNPAGGASFSWDLSSSFFIALGGGIEIAKTFNHNLLATLRRGFGKNYSSVYFFSSSVNSRAARSVKADLFLAGLATSFSGSCYFDPGSSPYRDTLFDAGFRTRVALRNATVFLNSVVSIDPTPQYSVFWGMNMRKVLWDPLALSWTFRHRRSEASLRHSFALLFNIAPLSFLSVLAGAEPGFESVTTVVPPSAARTTRYWFCECTTGLQWSVVSRYSCDMTASWRFTENSDSNLTFSIGTSGTF